MENYIVLETYDNAFEAELAKGLLEENGIVVELKNALINSIYPTFAGDMYHLELCVAVDQSEAARLILDTYTDGFTTHKILQQEGALLEGHFQLTSGRHSSRYIEKIRILQNPEQASLLCKMIAERLAEHEFDAVAGPAYGGIALAFETARQLGSRFLFAQRQDEKMTVRSGFDLSAIKSVVIIEDIVTTGGSVKEVIDYFKSVDINVAAIAAIVDRSGGKVDFGCEFIPLLTLDIPSWEAEECPLCKSGTPLTKPGSSDK
ncbi:MAG: orotate phosphoribosyltransferase [Candidatus Cloacimonadaceae bacterium]